MYNLRYHIASLVAVFLSLAIGLLLGTIVVERGTLDRQRDSIVEALQEEFRTLADENAELRDENDSRDDFLSATLPLLLEGRLDGRTVAIVVNTGRVDGLAPASDAIRLAGGTPITVTLNEESLGLARPEVSDAATAVIGPRLDEELVASIAASMTGEWLLPAQDRPLTSALVMSGAISMEEIAPETVIDAVVVIASWEGGGPDEFALLLGSQMVAAGGSAVGVESRTNQTGVPPAAFELGLSAVEDVGRPEGQYSLVYVLSGAAEGYFGYGEQAQSLYPLPAVAESE